MKKKTKMYKQTDRKEYYTNRKERILHRQKGKKTLQTDRKQHRYRQIKQRIKTDE
jgi:hypothetical protein